jgi:(p)ppGpp synthase/HD superfamily hydrolase
MSTLDNAIQIAADAHKGQKDKVGAPYILHSIRIMLKMDTAEEMMAAVLHDVVEDSDITIDYLKQKNFSDEIINAVLALTHQINETYEEFIDRASANPIAKKVKVADLEDNMNILRIKNLTDKDMERLKKYHNAWNKLSGK